MSAIYLDPVNQSFADALAASDGPPMPSLSYPDTRMILEDVNRHELATDVLRETVAVETPHGTVEAIVSKPVGAKGDLALAYYFHGGGWILGSPTTHEVIISDIVRQTGACVVFPYFTPAPEAQFPVQFEQSYAVVEHFVKNGSHYKLKTSAIVFLGDSVGGHMAIAMSTLATERQLPTEVIYQVLFYPVTDTARESKSYETFEDGPYLTAEMLRWMINTELPEKGMRESYLGSPLRLSNEQLAHQPLTLVVVASADPWRDEGLAFAKQLQQAGVETSLFVAEGQLHDFVSLLPIRSSPTARITVELACLKVKIALAGQS